MENTDEVALLDDAIANAEAVSDSSGTNNLCLMVIGCVNTFVYSLIAVSVFVSLCFAFQSIPLSAFQLHIGLSVLGYQLLMAYGILSFSSYNGWWSSLTYTHRRTSHLILQITGSALAIGGSAVMIKHKSVNFNTIHGKLALAALILTCMSLSNGLMTLFRVRYVSSTASKTIHLIFGTSAFAISSVCLSFGFNKETFRNWSSDKLAYLMIGITKCAYRGLLLFSAVSFSFRCHKDKLLLQGEVIYCDRLLVSERVCLICLRMVGFFVYFVTSQRRQPLLLCSFFIAGINIPRYRNEIADCMYLNFMNTKNILEYNVKRVFKKNLFNRNNCRKKRKSNSSKNVIKIK